MRFLPPAVLRALDRAALDALLDSEECVVAAGDGEVRGLAALALLRADYAVLTHDAMLLLGDDEARDAARHRGGDVADSRPVTAADAIARSLCDELIEGDPQAWFDRWVGSRSTAALDAAAVLLRSNGGDTKEREVFARLFAAGEPQRGLRAFLARRG